MNDVEKEAEMRNECPVCYSRLGSLRKWQFFRNFTKKIFDFYLTHGHNVARGP
jgi:hypothetical protein